VLIGLLLLRTVSRNADWRSETKLLAQALAKTPQSARLHYQYGLALGRKGSAEQAIEQYREAARLQPANARAQTALAIALGEAGSLDEAVQHFRQALQCEPANPQMHFNLAVALARQKQFAEAIAQYRQALSGPVQSADACNNLAWLLATCLQSELRNGTEAVAWASRAVQMAGEDDPDLLDTLAVAYAEAGNFDEADRIAQRAAELAGSRGSTDQAAAIRARLKLYLARKPYRE
jgi:Flp pilus assembly protein TadD